MSLLGCLWYFNNWTMSLSLDMLNISKQKYYFIIFHQELCDFIIRNTAHVMSYLLM